jgi:predicted aminopeptidase
MPSASGLVAGALALLTLLALGGCEAVPYYSQAINGEVRLLAAARPVADWLADPATPAVLRERLELAARIRTFASSDLSLPDNRSYTRYADLHRPSAVWNVFATPPLSLTLQTWCYPVFGCAAYRGYFARADAEVLAAKLRQQGLDASVLPVPAFSTLGWFSDPLLSTFINWPEPELARLIFHELAHQVVYVRDDTRFNESFATAVERAGLARWVEHRGDPALREQYRQYQLHHAGLLELLGGTQKELQALYDTPLPDAQRLARKQEILAQLPAHYRQMRDTRWNGFAGYDEFFLSPWNNARIAAMAAYQDDVPAFEALLASEGGDLPRFFTRVKALARLDPGEREQALAALLQPAPPAPPASPTLAAPPGATPTGAAPTRATPTPAMP